MKSMDSTYYLQKLAHLPRRSLRESLGVFQLVALSLANRVKRSPVVRPGGPVVSLTTISARSKKVHLAIESIASGSALPSRLILWIDHEALFNNLPSAIRRLQARGLEVKLCKNYGPHKKYYPYLESERTFDSPLVTADDDILYPHYWLKKLIEAFRERPDVLNCYGAHVIPLDDNGFARYNSWQFCESTTPSFCHLAMGGNGAIHPPDFLAVLKSAGTAFESCCPKGDDLWVHVQAVRAGYRVRQVLPRLPYFSFQGIPGTQQIALWRDNVDGDGNERQIKATYTEADLQILRGECEGTLAEASSSTPCLIRAPYVSGCRFSPSSVAADQTMPNLSRDSDSPHSFRTTSKDRHRSSALWPRRVRGVRNVAD